MGGSISQNVSNINKIINSNIVTSLQQSNNNINMKQDINAECSTEVVKQIMSDYVDCLSISPPTNKSDKQIKDTCIDIYSNFCKMNKINVTDNLNLTNLSQQKAETEQTISNSVKNSLTQIAGSDINQSITSNNLDTTILASNILQDINKNTDSINKINLFGTSANYITQTNISNIVSTSLQNNKHLQSVVNDIAVTITQKAENSNSIYTTLLIVIGVIIISYLLISFIMVLKRSDNLSDFWHTIYPYFIWFLLITITTSLHILVPPKYITYLDKSTPKPYTKKINIYYLLLYLLVYYIGFAILIFAFFKIKKLFR